MRYSTVLSTMLPLATGFFFHDLSSHGRRVLSNLEIKATKTSTVSQRSGEFWDANMDCWRPTVNDVERISWGKPAKKKGTGSRGVPHRLNEEERFLFDQARRKGFLEINASGWRKQRREAPLLNTYRSLCDARGQASVVLHKGSTGVDELVVDISPLRVPARFAEIAEVCQQKYEGAEIFYQGSISLDLSMTIDAETEEYEIPEELSDEAILESFETRPIYQLPPYCIAWELERSQAKSLGKQLAEDFVTKEEGKKSKKPIGVKAGKGRRHGGYGIG